MAGASKFAEVLPAAYGGVILTGVGSVFLNMWLAINVGKARKQHEVKLPIMYHPTNMDFNCVQRAHQNYLETYPQFLMLLFIGGLQYPRTATAAGITYLIGRVLYAKGYYTGEPAKRRQGFMALVAQAVLMGCVLGFVSRNFRHQRFHFRHW